MKICGKNHHALYCKKRDKKTDETNTVEKTHREYVNMLNSENEIMNEIQKVENFDLEFANYINKIDILNNNSNGPIDSKIYRIDQSADSILRCLTLTLKNGKEITMLVDSGSTVSMIEEHIADEAQLRKLRYCHTELRTIISLFALLFPLLSYNKYNSLSGKNFEV